ncbi:DarT ssDNA thymidine ADP-ribosyltransferase family protein [Streptomyces bacillaris]|uniref:DarT ssDNA thymidine ADP-ribosyltransferase family protein n=1 Tax=Streptomyces bacillaris TaxID=68179 RepID=UPI003EBEDDFE
MTEIWDEAQRRGITRLCHFTKSANLSHILATGELRDALTLRASTEGFRPTDLARLDGLPDHINCSIEYPNTWYLDRAMADDPHFKEWVILDLDPALLTLPGAKFCPYNAARGRGIGIRSGFAAFTDLFEASVSGNATRARTPHHPDWWPTDDQAEVLLPGPIPLARVRGVIVKDAEQAELEHYRLTRHLDMGSVMPPLSIAPGLFDKYQLSRTVRAGRRPAELPFVP